MMKKLRKIYREKSDFLPKMVFDKENGIFQLEGRSLPEDSEAVYGPVLEWLDDYADDPNPETVMVFRLEYYNSASLKKFADILVTLRRMGEQKGVKASAIWYYEDGDESSLENAEDLITAVGLPFETRVIPRP